MRILLVHAIPSADTLPVDDETGFVAEQTALLTSAMRSAQLPGLSKNSQNEVEDFSLSRQVSLSVFQTRLQLFCPDVVHIHGGWDRRLFNVAQKSKAKGVPVVYTPCGALQLWRSTSSNVCKRMVQYWWFQRPLTQRAAMIQVWGNSEKQWLVEHKMNERIQVVESALLSNLIDAETMATQMLQLYQQVVDNRIYTLLTEKEKEATWSLLHVGLTGDGQNHHLTPNQVLNLRSLSVNSWRTIMVYANYQDVADIVMRGATKMQLNMPSQLGTHILGYEAKKRSDETQGNDNTTHAPAPPNDTLQLLMTHIEAIHHLQATSRHLKLGRLAPLYSVLSTADYDEDQLARELHKQKLYHFACRIMQILSETFLLEPGFMPVPPINDRKTEQLRAKTIKQPIIL